MAKAEATVGELVGMIERGERRLPEMQRRYAWRSTRAHDPNREGGRSWHRVHPLETIGRSLDG